MTDTDKEKLLNSLKIILGNLTITNVELEKMLNEETLDSSKFDRIMTETNDIIEKISKGKLDV